MDKNQDGKITIDEFKEWYYAWVAKVPESAFDVLFARYTPDSYWWFVQVLWLKLGINFLFTVRDGLAHPLE